MKVTRRAWDGGNPEVLAGELRRLSPPLSEVSDEVAAIIAAVAQGGDSALREISSRFDVRLPEQLRVPNASLDSAPDTLDPALADALRISAANVRAVAEAQLHDRREVKLEQGQTIGLREVPVGAAGIYAPGGFAAYPTTVLMGAIPAKVAGVERVVVGAPPGADGDIADVVLAACAISGADEVYAVGGAQAIAALARGTESIAPVDVIAGPGNRYVQEAKRQLVGEVGIDGLAGPSELMVIAGETTNVGWIALDLCAQAEHGADGLLVACAVERAILDQVEDRVEALAAERASVTDAPLALVESPDTDSALALAEALAPEHLEIATEDAELLAQQVTTAGCVFVGGESATGFGDYIAGSNHVLPTGGAARFQGPLGPAAFRRRIATVTVSARAAAALAGPAATLAEAEGFPVHGESMLARSSDRAGSRDRAGSSDGEHSGPNR